MYCTCSVIFQCAAFQVTFYLTRESEAEKAQIFSSTSHSKKDTVYFCSGTAATLDTHGNDWTSVHSVLLICRQGTPAQLVTIAAGQCRFELAVSPFKLKAVVL